MMIILQQKKGMAFKELHQGILVEVVYLGPRRRTLAANYLKKVHMENKLPFLSLFGRVKEFQRGGF